VSATEKLRWLCAPAVVGYSGLSQEGTTVKVSRHPVLVEHWPSRMTVHWREVVEVWHGARPPVCGATNVFREETYSLSMPDVSYGPAEQAVRGRRKWLSSDRTYEARH
jgi:hypothetical protein